MCLTVGTNVRDGLVRRSWRLSRRTHGHIMANLSSERATERAPNAFQCQNHICSSMRATGICVPAHSGNGGGDGGCVVHMLFPRARGLQLWQLDMILYIYCVCGEHERKQRAR